MKALTVLLYVEKRGQPRCEFAFRSADRFLIGRAKEAHLRLLEDDPFVSRNHCLIEICPPNIFLSDLESTNGTWVNGTTVRERVLQDGDVIRIGATTLRVEVTCGDATLEERLEGDQKDNPLPAPGPEQTRVELPVKVTAECKLCQRMIEETASNEAWIQCEVLCQTCGQSLAEAGGCKQVGEYLLLKEIGRGGMGIVYRAWHPSRQRLVALKKLLPSVAQDRRTQQLFDREIFVQKSLVHPNIVRLVDEGEDSEGRYLVSEYLCGGDLGKLVGEVRRAPLGVAEAVHCACQTLAGLSAAHEQGYVHRDIKPANLLLGNIGPILGPVKISDFGLAKGFAEAGASFMTQRGEAAGTLLYMAPEQIVNYRYVKPPADVYSMGVTLYYLLTGHLPFEFPSPLDRINGNLAGKHFKDEIRIVLEDDPIPIREFMPGISEDLAAVIDRSIRKNEQERFSSAAAMKKSLENASGENRSLVVQQRA